MKDLFGHEVALEPDRPALTPLEQRRQYRKNASVPRGHAAPPGTGPVGETCRSCVNYTRRHFHDYVHLKCGLMKDKWSKGPKTDIRAKDAACKFWERAVTGEECP